MEENGLPRLYIAEHIDDDPNVELNVFSHTDGTERYAITEDNHDAPFPPWMTETAFGDVFILAVRCETLGTARCLARLLSQISGRVLHIEDLTFSSEETVEIVLRGLVHSRDLTGVYLCTELNHREQPTTMGVSRYRFHYHCARAILDTCGRIDDLTIVRMDESEPEDIASFYRLLSRPEAGLRRVTFSGSESPETAVTSGILLLFRHNPIEHVSITYAGISTETFKNLAELIVERKSIQSLRIRGISLGVAEIKCITDIVGETRIKSVIIQANISRGRFKTRDFFEAVAKNQHLEEVFMPLHEPIPHDLRELMRYVIGHPSLKRMYFLRASWYIDTEFLSSLQARLDEYFGYSHSWKANVLVMMCAAQHRSTPPANKRTRMSIGHLPPELLRVFGESLPQGETPPVKPFDMLPSHSMDI